MAIYKETTGQGEDIVLFHGAADNHKFMQPLVKLLSSRYRVTNIERPGSGLSDWNPSIASIDDLADEMLSELPEKAIYIGWSFGGHVCMSIAARYPERVKRIIGICTSPKFIENDNWIGLPKPGFSPAFAGIHQIGYNPFVQAFIDGEFASCEPKPAAYYELTAILDRGTKRDLDILLKIMQLVDSSDVRKELQAIRCPIDLIFCENDAIAPVAAIEQIKKLNPAVQTFIIISAQHMPFWTHPVEFIKILNTLLK
ncbi:MAG: alpha/beta fold hydrolase [Gammaproteobacteria bacterium]|nr:alpha/beta fold hydrolase [Gammaproteobacteria bacterium]